MQDLYLVENSPTDHPLECTCGPLRAAQARDAACGFLADLNPPPPESTVQNVLLLVSELVTNALRHAGAVTALNLRADRHLIQVTVEDPSPAHPQDRSPDLSGRTGGFGWPLIQRLAHSVTVVQPRFGPGKAIIAALPR
ncbi:ATP-binding protein [Streptomyces sp. NPDC002044]|uniref:ATP-binding protein n=1 Tax=Streptomyces sp. NPDC002044 TaxID=3154662 RepID=UPI0033252B1F